MISKEIAFNHIDNPILLFGEHDYNIRYLEEEFFVSIFPRGNILQIEGDKNNVSLTEKILDILFKESQDGYNIKRNDLKVLVSQVRDDAGFKFDYLQRKGVYIGRLGKLIKPKTTNQAHYIDAIKKHDIVFGVGPAGTGKTYLAVAMGISALLSGSVKRLIITRPVVEAGESLGFLPGDLNQKITPYLRPIFDAMFDMISYEDYTKYTEKEKIEIAPLAYMRGRTLNDAFTILDEAQNITTGQLKMFLTRLGPKSKTVLTGDLTQIDIPKKNDSGLLLASKILKDIKGIHFTYFDSIDIVRHALVKDIISAFDSYERGL